jgi:HEAT repeat protein
MSTNSDGSSNSGAETDGQKRVRRPQSGLRTLIALVACCAVILWAWRYLSENYDPLLVESRSLQRRAIGTLRSSKQAERLAAIRELGRPDSANSSIVVPRLIGALEDPVAEVRVAAAEALGLIDFGLVKEGSGGETIREAATALIRSLKDPESAVRLAAAETLGSIGPSVLKSGSGGETVRDSATALTRCLKDPEPGVRAAAVTSLGMIASTSPADMATPPIDRKDLMDALVETLGDRDANVRLAVIKAMASHPSESGDPPKALAEGLKDESAENRAAAVSGLNSFRQGLDPLVPLLLRLFERDPDPYVREQCFSTLSVAFKPPAITAAVVPVLTASLRSEDAQVRSQVVWLLSVFRADARAAIPELLRILNEPLDPQVAPDRNPFSPVDPASDAASVLGSIAPSSAEEKEVIAALIEVARSGPRSRCGSAAYALGEFGPAAEEAVPVLTKVLNDATPDDKFEHEASAVFALGRIAPDTSSADQAVAALLPVLHSKNWLAQTNAIEALPRFGPKAAAAIPRLRALKDDRDTNVRDAAAKALLSIENDSVP